MAIGDTTQLAELINRYWDKPFADLVARDYWMLKRFPHVPGKADGPRWKVQADAKNTSAAGYAEGAALPTAVAHRWLDAKLAWKFVWVGVEVTGQTKAQMKGEGGFTGYSDALAVEVEQSLLDLRDKINTMLLATTVGANDIDSILTGVDDAVTYASINPATFTEWKSYSNNNTGTNRALTIALMQDVKTSVEDTPRFGNVSVVMTTPSIWNTYGNLLTSLRRFSPQAKLDGGFQALDFEGVPVVKVPSHPANRLLFLSEKDKQGNASIQYRVLKNFETLDKSQSKADSMFFLITHYAQLQCRSRRIHGLLEDIS